jgi:hypothetical protein
MKASGSPSNTAKPPRGSNRDGFTLSPMRAVHPVTAFAWVNVPTELGLIATELIVHAELEEDLLR